MLKALLPAGLVLVGGEAAMDLDYFDQLREVVADENPSFAVEPFDAYNNLFHVTGVEESSSLLLASFSLFLPLSETSSDDQRELQTAVLADALIALLAIHHVNNPELLPEHFRWKNELQQNCRVKITAQLSDSAYSPISSTRLFTNILQQKHTVGTPLPAGVVGAYRSSVTSPLAILTGVNNIPQIAYAATSTDFDVKEQYPLFGRTCQSAVGEAAVSVHYFYSHLKATHVGVMFVTDSFGSALQKAFQDTASQYNITTASVAFSTTASPNEIEASVASLGDTDYRQFYVICFEQHYRFIMKAAYDKGLIGDDYVWIFDGLGAETFHEMLVFPRDSDLAKATQGIGVFSTSGGLRPETVPHPLQGDDPPPVQHEPVTGYEAIRKLYREAAQNQDVIDYMVSKLPDNFTEEFDLENFELRLEPTTWGPFLYDAVTTLALSYCRATAEVTDVANLTGFDVYDQFKVLDVQGATGQVQIEVETGTRNYTTLGRTLHNYLSSGVGVDGNEFFHAYPTHHYQDGNWSKLMDFVYADGGTATPPSLPAPNVNMNYIGKLGRAVGYTLMGLAMTCCLTGLTWLLVFFKERVVSASQPLFLVMVAVGSFVTTSAIVPLSLEETMVGENGGLDLACQFSPWLYISGMVLMLSALLAKTRGVHQAYSNPELEFIHITSFDIMRTFLLLFGTNLIVMIPWSIVAPLEWDRIDKDSTDRFDRPVESYGTCGNGSATPFLVVVLLLNIFIVAVGNWWAYQSRNIETEYHESRYIGIALASILQAWLMGIPILIVVSDNPQARFFVQAGIIFVTALAALLLVYVPKMLAVKTDRIKAEEESKRLAYTAYKTESQRRGFGIEDPDEPNENVTRAVAPTSVLRNAGPVGGVSGASEDLAKKKTSGADAEESGTPAVSDDSGLSVPAMAAAAAEVAAGQSKQSTRSLQRQSSLGLLGAARASFRNSSRKNLSPSRSSSMPFDGSDENIGMIKVLHNPRSARNLEVAGGMEVSRRQLEFLEDLDNEVSDDDILNDDAAVIAKETPEHDHVGDGKEPQSGFHQSLPVGQPLGPVLEDRLPSQELLKAIEDADETENKVIDREDGAAEPDFGGSLSPEHCRTKRHKRYLVDERTGLTNEGKDEISREHERSIVDIENPASDIEDQPNPQDTDGDIERSCGAGDANHSLLPGQEIMNDLKS